MNNPLGKAIIKALSNNIIRNKKKYYTNKGLNHENPCCWASRILWKVAFKILYKTKPLLNLPWTIEYLSYLDPIYNFNHKYRHKLMA